MSVGGQWMTPKGGGDPAWMPDAAVPEASASGHFEPLPADAQVGIMSPTGEAMQIPLTELERYHGTQQGHVRTPDEQGVISNRSRIEDEHGGAVGAIGAGLWSAADTVGLGLPGAAIKALDPSAYRSLQEGHEAHPIASGIGAGGALVGTALLTGGASLGAEGVAEGGAAIAEGAEAAEAPSSIASFLAKTPAGYVNRVGNSIRAAGEGVGLAGRVASGAAAGVAEGGLYGAGNAVEQLAASDDPLTAERIAHVFADNIGSGALLGGVIGGGGELAISGAKAAAGTLGKVADAIGKARSTADIPEELLTKEGLVAGRKAAVDDIREYHQAVSEADPWLAMEKSKVLTATKNSVRGQLDDAVGLAEDPGRALRAIRTQRQALEVGLKDGDAVVAKLAVEDKAMAQELNQRLASLPDDAETISIDGKMAQRYSKNVLGKSRSLKAKPLDISIDAAGQLSQALDAGEMQGARAEALQKLPGLIDHAKKVEDRLVQLRDASEALKNQPKGLVGKLAGAAGHNAPAAVMALAYGHPIAAIGALGADLAAKAVGHVAKRVLGVVREAGMRSASAVDGLVGGASKAAKGVARATVPSSVTVLNGMHADKSPAPKGETPLTTAYKRASAALHQQVQIGIDGQPVMTDVARRQLAAKLAPIAAINPQLADQVETLHAAAIAFLAVRAPKPPSFESGMLGPTRWQPSALEVAKFARTVAAAKDPGGIEERAAAGIVSPEDIEVYKTLYPARLAAFIQQIAERLPTLDKPLPFAKRMALAQLTGAPLVPALLPSIGGVIQGLYQNEPGSNGGTQAPRPNAQFGSLSKSANQLSTPLQARGMRA